MSTGNLTALVGALAALVTAVGGVIALFRHANGPAHQDPPVPAGPVLVPEPVPEPEPEPPAVHTEVVSPPPPENPPRM